MGTLGQYLKEAREAKGVDLHDAAQETRISIHFLRALEAEDFTRLPGEVFVKGFLKSYAKYLSLPESEVVQRYRDMKPKPAGTEQAPASAEQAGPVCEQKPPTEVSLEAVVWGAVLFIGFLVFLFTAGPAKREQAAHPVAGTSAPQETVKTVGEPIYLRIVALEDVWVLVRTDASPQKKAVLKKGESITWSAKNRFLLSYASLGAIQLFLNEQELTVTGAKNAVVRDLVVTEAGVETASLRTLPVVQPKPQPKPQAQPAPAPDAQVAPDQETAQTPPQARPAPAPAAPQPRVAPAPQAAPAPALPPQPASEPQPKPQGETF